MSDARLNRLRSVLRFRECVAEIDRLSAALKNRQAAIEARIDRLEQNPTSAYDEMTPAEAYHEALCDALEAMRGHL